MGGKNCPPFNICPAEGWNRNGSACWEWPHASEQSRKRLKLHLQNVADHPLGKTTKLLCCSAAAGGVSIGREACLQKKKGEKKSFYVNEKLCNL